MALDEKLIAQAKQAIERFENQQKTDKETRRIKAEQLLGAPRPELGLKSGEVQVVAYNPLWPYFFEVERARLEVLLGDKFAGRIEHVGSTAVRGLKAKPIIDIVIGCRRPAEVNSSMAALLNNGYTYVPEVNKISKSKFFAKGQPRLYHIHIVHIGSIAWQNLIQFRDLLRSDHNYRSQYASLKDKLIANLSKNRGSNDPVRINYSQAKSSFIDILCMRAARSSKFRRAHTAFVRAGVNFYHKVTKAFPPRVQSSE